MINLKKIKSKKTISELLEFGIINIDKPQNPTSFDVSDFVRRKFNEAGIKIRKTSHFGTLDPKVTGVLPIALNRACKLTGFFLGEDKEYVGIMRIHEEVSLSELKKIIKEKFLGKIKQIPPKKSRVARILREREIKSFELLEQDEKNILFRAEVQGGTYIRKLIDDLGREIKTGAHMLELHRVRAGIFKEDDKKYPSVNLYDFEKAVEEFNNRNEEELRRIIIPAEIVSEVYPVVFVKEEIVKNLLTGKSILNEDLIKKQKLETEKIISVFSNEKFIGMYKVLNQGGVFAKAKFVMQEIK